MKEMAEGRIPESVVQPNQSQAEALAAMSAEDKVDAVADNIAEQIVDAISGTATGTVAGEEEAPSPPPLADIEATAEKVAARELAAEDSSIPSSSSTASRWTSPTSILASYEDSLRALFSDDLKLLVSQRDLTTVAMEGVAGGMALMGLLFVLLRPR